MYLPIYFGPNYINIAWNAFAGDKFWQRLLQQR